jgi:hypothetical protein
VPNIGITASGSGWATDKSEGNIAKYLAETRSFMQTKAKELEQQIAMSQDSAKLQLYSDKLGVLHLYLRAVSLLDHVEATVTYPNRSSRSCAVYTIQEALESLRDLLIVCSIKVRTKWSTAEGFTHAVARETAHCLRRRMHSIVHMIRPQIVRGGSFCEGRSAQSLVRVSRTARSLHSKDNGTERWEGFADASGIRDVMGGVIPKASAPQTDPAPPRIGDCRRVLETLAKGRNMPRGLLIASLQQLMALLDAGYQTVLFANNACTVALTLLESHVDDDEIALLLCTALEKLCVDSAHCARALIEQHVWRQLTRVLERHAGSTTGLCTCVGELMTSLLSSSEENKKLCCAAFEDTQLFSAIKHVLLAQTDEVNAKQALLHATVHALDKSYTADSEFVTCGLFELLITKLMMLSPLPGVKLQLVVAVGRLSSGNRYMQERLVALDALDALHQIIVDTTTAEAGLLKLTCFAVGTLVAKYHAGQTKFATLGGCRTLCHALRSTHDLNVLTYILRTVAALALQNAYVQDFFELEGAVELMNSKREEVSSLAKRTESFEMKSKLNLLLLTCEYALDAVRPRTTRRAAAETAHSGDAADNGRHRADRDYSDAMAALARLEALRITRDGSHRPPEERS